MAVYATEQTTILIAGFIELKYFNSKQDKEKEWKTRFVSLHSSNNKDGTEAVSLNLSVHEKNDNIISDIHISGVTRISRVHLKKKPFTVSINCLDGTSLSLNPSSETDAQKWIHILRSVLLNVEGPPFILGEITSNQKNGEAKAKSRNLQNCYPVAVIDNHDSIDLGISAYYVLKVSLASLSLLDIKSQVLVHEWPFTQITKFAIPQTSEKDHNRLLSIHVSREALSETFTFFVEDATKIMQNVSTTKSDRASPQSPGIIVETSQSLYDIVRNSDGPSSDSESDEDSEYVYVPSLKPERDLNNCEKLSERVSQLSKRGDDTAQPYRTKAIGHKGNVAADIVQKSKTLGSIPVDEGASNISQSGPSSLLRQREKNIGRKNAVKSRPTSDMLSRDSTVYERRAKSMYDKFKSSSQETGELVDETYESVESWRPEVPPSSPKKQHENTPTVTEQHSKINKKNHRNSEEQEYLNATEIKDSKEKNPRGLPEAQSLKTVLQEVKDDKETSDSQSNKNARSQHGDLTSVYEEFQPASRRHGSPQVPPKPKITLPSNHPDTLRKKPANLSKNITPKNLPKPSIHSEPTEEPSEYEDVIIEGWRPDVGLIKKQSPSLNLRGSEYMEMGPKPK